MSASLFQENSAADGGAILVDEGSLQLTNALLVWNSSTVSGGGVRLQETATYTGNFLTHGGESAPTGASVAVMENSSATLGSSIIYGATTGAAVHVDTTASLSIEYCNVYGNAEGNYENTTDPTGIYGNISSDPSFGAYTADGDPSNDTWQLGAQSPCIDAGDPTQQDPDGTLANMGCFGGSGADWIIP